MEEHYIKDVGKITYEYGVNLEEHKTVIEKQQKRIAELEQELAELKSKYEDCENERLQNRMDYLTMKNKWLNSEKKLAELKEKAIVPKFKVGQEIWCIQYMAIFKFKINKVEIHRGEEETENRIIYGNWEDMIYQIEENCFATEQEAQEKLKEIQGNE